VLIEMRPPAIEVASTGGGLSAAKTSSWGVAFVNAPKFTPRTSHAAYVKTAHMRRVPQSTRVKRFAL